MSRITTSRLGLWYTLLSYVVMHNLEAGLIVQRLHHGASLNSNGTEGDSLPDWNHHWVESARHIVTAG